MKDYIAIAIAVVSVAVLWGGTQATVLTLKDDVREIKTWKDIAIQQMGRMDSKLDFLVDQQKRRRN